jgi:hypothetical protein
VRGRGTDEGRRDRDERRYLWLLGPLVRLTGVAGRPMQEGVPGAIVELRHPPRSQEPS